jgi:hypothetical protein
VLGGGCHGRVAHQEVYGAAEAPPGAGRERVASRPEVQRCLDPKADDEFERDLVRAVGTARTLVGDALETIRVRLWE